MEEPSCHGLISSARVKYCYLRNGIHPLVIISSANLNRSVFLLGPGFWSIDGPTRGRVRRAEPRKIHRVHENCTRVHLVYNIFQHGDPARVRRSIGRVTHHFFSAKFTENSSRRSCLANSARSFVVWIRKVLIYEEMHAQFALKWWSRGVPPERLLLRAGHVVMSAGMTSLAEIVAVIEFHATSDPKLRHGEP
jgi:hypothetical protein